jgi:hypothetical protein
VLFRSVNPLVFWLRSLSCVLSSFRVPDFLFAFRQVTDQFTERDLTKLIQYYHGRIAGPWDDDAREDDTKGKKTRIGLSRCKSQDP